MMPEHIRNKKYMTQYMAQYTTQYTKQYIKQYTVKFTVHNKENKTLKSKMTCWKVDETFVELYSL